jgi:hypothetical protein
MLYTMKSTNVAFAGIVNVDVQIISVDYERYIIVWMCYLDKRKYVHCDVLNYVKNEHKLFISAATNARS